MEHTFSSGDSSDTMDAKTARAYLRGSADVMAAMNAKLDEQKALHRACVAAHADYRSYATAERDRLVAERLASDTTTKKLYYAYGTWKDRAISVQTSLLLEEKRTVAAQADINPLVAQQVSARTLC
jgi:hypothetical protein